MYRQRDGRELEFEEVGRDASYVSNQEVSALTHPQVNSAFSTLTNPITFDFTGSFKTCFFFVCFFFFHTK